MNLIVGSNGVGKSTFLDALTFCLYGKPYRRINKPNLVNSINQKGLLTEVDFTVTENKRSRRYRIVRGIKPNIFEIYENDKLIDQADKTRDQQKFLEENILKVNYRAFIQIVVLGTANYIPFMKLTPQQRREFIENLLDINIFSSMNVILKERLGIIRTLTEKNAQDIRSVQDKISIQEGFVRKLESVTQSVNSEIEELRKEVDKDNQEIVRLSQEIAKLSGKLVDEEKVNRIQERIQEIHDERSEIRAHRRDIEKTNRFFDNNSVCPTCTQDIEQSHVKRIRTKNDDVMRQYEETDTQLVEELDKLSSVFDTIIKTKEQIRSLRERLKNHEEHAKSVEETIDRKKKQREDQHTKEHEKESLKLDQMRLRLDELNIRKETINQKSMTYDVVYDLLKDSGIKSRIISQYVPVINKLINQYLTEMSFHVNFNIDENFDEKILSRYRDEFTYDNFSQGEKLRIDIALLMVWRIIAEMKSSLNTNLLIMDEIFDSSLDSDGLEDFLKILKTVSQTNNIFIISHKVDQLESKFDRTIKVRKQNDYSYMEVL
jgi:DNA repair exonuclease SbcCD ATPase subunit